MARKPTIPEVRATDPQDFLWKKSVKDTIEQLTGVRGGQIAPLPAGATSAQIVAKLNELIARVNFG